MKIKDRISQIIKIEGPAIIVLKGFDKDVLDSKLKYFEFNIDFYDTVNLDSYKDSIVNTILEKREIKSSYLWMTIEEYQIFKEYKNIINSKIILLDNNLFDKQYPYRNTLTNIESIYHNLYYVEDQELSEENTRLLENISRFYGQINYSKQSNNYYVTYIEDEDMKEYKLYQDKNIDVKLQEEINIDDLYQIELSDDEIPFLDLIMELKTKKQHKNVLFILSSSLDDLPNKYLERINILKSLTNLETYFSTSSIKRKIIENEEEYLAILNELYGYGDFKTIDFYKDIESRSKEVVRISQGQIIDDIVIQSENAMHGDPFRDVYITASTGAGKSIMFQIPALYLSQKYPEEKPLTLVISPLIGLMNDQVDSMKRKGINNAATINGNTPPYERENILEDIEQEKIDILYLSPETLQARSDIKMLIGDRNIGVVIIDEAHIVTTWGKSFRSDYWYLGIYLAKLRKEYKFPIVTFTAMAIYGGQEDMYVDTRNSLNMISPISYFGKVKRDEIFMVVNNGQKDFDDEGRDYRKTKHALALRHMENSFKQKKKSLIYFPTVKLLQEFYSFINKNAPNISEVTGRYYGNLRKEEKDEVLEQYKDGELQFVLATKAFGMGIDIPDITYVYHYAPTGNVVDYIQEVGRAARDEDLVKNGFGVVDFFKARYE